MFFISYFVLYILHCLIIMVFCICGHDRLNLNKSTLSETPTPNSKVSKVAPNDKVSGGTPITKVSPATPKVAKLSRGVAKLENGSASPLQSSRVSVDRSPGSVTSKPVVDRRSPKISTTPDVRFTFPFVVN